MAFGYCPINSSSTASNPLPSRAILDLHKPDTETQTDIVFAVSHACAVPALVYSSAALYLFAVLFDCFPVALAAFVYN